MPKTKLPSTPRRRVRFRTPSPLASTNDMAVPSMLLSPQRLAGLRSISRESGGPVTSGVSPPATPRTPRRLARLNPPPERSDGPSAADLHLMALGLPTGRTGLTPSINRISVGPLSPRPPLPSLRRTEGRRPPLSGKIGEIAREYDRIRREHGFRSPSPETAARRLKAEKREAKKERKMLERQIRKKQLIKLLLRKRREDAERAEIERELARGTSESPVVVGFPEAVDADAVEDAPAPLEAGVLPKRLTRGEKKARMGMSLSSITERGVERDAEFWLRSVPTGQEARSEHTQTTAGTSVQDSQPEFIQGSSKGNVRWR
ncbi:hypothetical protein OBBRIDRAFT_807799 [Obba rivulosa]|uniref:Uncharacterized protein n=1 Tax=Obba rivulosa TaxID=1052685 RepID=A0A8E2AMM9_9APHY|nr:hypothetical protein OBBRIDRAFT_807799 [Obba rivulosa]